MNQNLGGGGREEQKEGGKASSLVPLWRKGNSLESEWGR